MELDFNINLEQKQDLILTPELKMAIEILQYSSLELSEFIDKEIQENPLLEKMEKFQDNKYSYNNSITKDKIEYEKFISYKPSFCESLENQLFEVLNDNEIRVGKFIVGSFNDQGELTLDLEVIADLFEIELAQVETILEKIKKLNIDFSDLNPLENKVDYVEPDMIVKKELDDYKIIYKEKFSPTLKINNYYYNLLKQSDDPECIEYLKNKHRSAIWLIKSIIKRRETIKKIAEAILKKQKRFFEKGLEYLEVLTMEDVAKEIEMNESTVSRATTGKYMQTPHGVFNLKLFFNSGIDNVSSVSIKAILSKEIAKEDKAKPLTDSKLAEVLQAKHEISINRRTVAKYRKSLGIGSSRARKKSN